MSKGSLIERMGMHAIVIWDDEPGANIDHTAEHGLTPEEVDDVLLSDLYPMEHSQSTGRPCKFGWTSTGRHIIVVWDVVCGDPLILAPVTAYEVTPEQRG